MNQTTHHRYHACFRATVIFILFLVLAPSLAAATEKKKTILYLNSYHNGYQWSDSLLEGVRSVLNKSQFKVDLQIEYMDAKKFAPERISANLHDLYKEKFKDESFDSIIISDNDALNFINTYRTELFPDIPIVFCGINDLKESDISGGNITGVAEVFDLQATIEVAKKLHPKRNHIIILIDSSTAGEAIRRQIQTFVSQQDIGLETEYWIDLSLEEAQRRVRTLPDNAFLFIAPYYQTIDGRFYASEEVSEAISSHSSVPIYTAWEFMVGYGAVGGKVLSGIVQGRVAGEMALEILKGTAADDIPIQREPSGIYLFDYQALNKMDINMQLLPPESTIINSPKAIYSMSKELFWTIMVSFILLLLALVLMLGAMVERRKVELRITEQLTFQETLMDTIPQLVSWKGLDGRYLGANQAFMDFFGIADTDQVVGKATNEVVGDTSYSSWSAQADAKVIDQGRALRKKRRRVTDETGREAWIEVNKVPLRGQGNRIVGVLSTAENITKEQSLEKQLLQSQKMEAIGTLAGGIAHDFNNILTSIINSTELAIGDLEEGSQTERDLQRVLKAAHRGGRVVQQILSFSRPSREGFRPTDLQFVVQEVAHLLEASMPANINVTNNSSTDTPCYVLADPTQMHQAILNLGTNAFHALRATGGTIDITLDRVDLRAHDISLPETDTTHGIRLAVTDDGPGIPGDILDKIFDPFFSTKSKTEGTGLGLAVVHGIVKSHLGEIRVRNRVDRGAVFEIFLPESTAATEMADHDNTAGVNTAGRILFVEDNEDQLATTPRLLEEAGFRLTAVRQAAEALRMIDTANPPFCLLITDFDMPGINGAELAARVDGLPVILISGRNDAATAARDLPNIRRVIIKPYHKQDLIDAIHDSLNPPVKP